MLVRQLAAAIARSASVKSTCTSFSAAAKVAGFTSGPTAGAVPNAGGVPSGVCWDFTAEESFPSGCWAAAAAEASMVVDLTRNSRRDFDTLTLHKGDGSVSGGQVELKPCLRDGPRRWP